MSAPRIQISILLSWNGSARPSSWCIDQESITGSLQSLCLENNNFGRDGIKYVLSFVQSNLVLEELYLCQNLIDHKEEIDQLCEIIKVHPSINTIKLIECRGEGLNGFEMLHSIVDVGANKLKEINLSSND